MRAEQQIQQLASEVGTSAPIETVVIVGSPPESIAQIAVARVVGLIVMGLRRQEHILGRGQALSRIACWVWRQPGC
jgi:nucleotide-binding universal stress UspA family protein